MIKKICFFLFVVVLCLSLAGTVSGATIYVNATNSGTEDGLSEATGWSTIQEGINNASTGDTVQVLAGTYAENVVVNKSVTLTGAGITSTTVQNATSGSDVFNIVADWVNISGFKIQGALNSNYASIHINGANNTNISNNNVTGSWYGIHVDRGLNNTITNNTAVLNQNDGILLNHSNYTTLRNNTAKDNSQAGSWGNGICLGAEENYHNTIEDNTIIGNYYGIYLDNSDNNSIANNTVNSNSQYGIYFYSSSNNTIKNNTASSNSQSGIYVDSSSSNTLTNNTANNNTQYGIYLISSVNNTITDNTANGPSQSYGIYLTGSSNNNTLTSNNASGNSYGIFLSTSLNTLTNNTASSSASYGIQLSGANNNTMTNNTASGNIRGIYLLNSNENDVIGSTLTSNNYGIYLSSSTDNTLTNNTANSNSKSGIYVESSSNNTIKNNTASSNSQSGIYVRSSSNNNTITNNTASSNIITGIFLDCSQSNNLTNNEVWNNTYGIHLESGECSETRYNLITNNTASSNTNYGIYLYYSNYNNFTNNILKINGWDFYSKSSSSNTVNTNLFNNTKASFTYSGDIKVNSSSSPASDPSGYQNIGKYLNITNTTAAWIYLNISYTAGDLGNLDESTLNIWKHNGSWSQVSGTNSVETTKNYVYANITSFSTFAPMGLIQAELEGDTTPPAITTQSPLNQTYNTSTIWFNVTLDETGSWCGYSLDGTANMTMTNSTGNWNAQNTSMAEGGHSVIFSCNDTSGNMNATSALWFTIDTTPPAVAITTPIDGATVNIFNDTINGTITDNQGIDWVKILLNGTVVHSWSAGGSTSITFIKVVNYTSGADNEINVTANDTSNNLASSSVTITVLSTEVKQVVNVTANETIVVDISNVTDVVLELFTAENVTGDINVTVGTNITDVNVTSLIGIAAEDEEVGKYISINVSDEIQGNLTWTILKMFYTLADLDRNGNGVLGDSEDIDPSKLKLYWHNTSGNTWLPLTTGANYEPTGPEVFTAGVNQTASDGYLGNVYANMSHYSVYGMYGSVYGGGGGITTTSSSPATTINAVREMAQPVITIPSQILPGSSVPMTIILENTGNVIERIVLSILDMPSDWIVTGDSVVSVNPGEKKVVTLTIKIPETATGSKTYTLRLTAKNFEKILDQEFTISIGKAETMTPATTAPPVTITTITKPPTTILPQKTAPPLTTTPPVVVGKVTPTTLAPTVTKPKITTRPPATTAPPATKAPKEEKKGICGPTLILFLTMIPLLFSQNTFYPKIFK